MRQEPAHLVHAWVGNSEGVAEDHFLMATDEDFERASGKATLKTTLSALLTAAQAWSLEMKTAASPGIPEDTAVSVPPRGVEGTRFRGRNTKGENLGDSKSDSEGWILQSIPAGLPGWIQEQITALPPEVIGALWAIFRSHCPPSETGQP